MSLEAIFELPHLAHQCGVRHAVISPGSRSAPLAVAFSRFAGIQIHVVPDERSAGFIGLGIAEASGAPVILICTSGTALMNYGPAVAEAWYKNLPLCVFSADRPPELIDQADGQAIRQPGVFGRHVKSTLALPVPEDAASGDAIRMDIMNALRCAVTGPAGPVHVNIPLREPLYPADGAEYVLPSISEMDRPAPVPRPEATSFPCVTSHRVLVICGQMSPSLELNEGISNLVSGGVPVVGDATSNLHDVPGLIRHHERMLGGNGFELVAPEIVVSMGGPVLSKGLKKYLRSCSDCDHWHILPAGEAPDTYGRLAKTIHMEPANALRELAGSMPAPDEEFSAGWAMLEKTGSRNVVVEPDRFTALAVVAALLEELPEGTVLHAGNSMAIRYVDAVGVPAGKGIVLRSNRGTSGIDGCVSAAVGHALAEERGSDSLHVALIGDVSYFYDANACWLDAPPANLRIVVLNDGGGGIFEMIPGPPALPECEELFVAPHELRVEAQAARTGTGYTCAGTHDELKQELMNLFQPEAGIKVLEVPTTRRENVRAWKHSRYGYEADSSA